MTSRHSKPEKNIPVFLNIDGNPQVKVDSMVWAKSKMAWVRDPESEDFNFRNLEFIPPDDSFRNLKVKDKKITLECPKVNNSAPSTLSVYKITVEAGEAQYTTDEGGPPEGDKPVIRN